MDNEETDTLQNPTSSDQTSAVSDEDQNAIRLEPLLSQDEIDLLLSTISKEDFPRDAGTPSTASSAIHIISSRRLRSRDLDVKEYDFTMANRLSKDCVKSLNLLYNSFALSLSSSLSSTMTTSVEVGCVYIEQLTYEEYLASLIESNCFGIFNIEPLKGLGVIEMNPTLVFSIIDKLLGGSGLSKPYNRKFTAIEETIITKVMDRVLRILQESWQQNVKVEMKFERLENNPGLMQIAEANDTVVLVLFNTILNDISSIMSLCFPLATIKQNFKKLGKLKLSSPVDDEKMEPYKNVIHKHMLDLPVTLSAQYKSNLVTLREFLELQKGDIIKLQNADKDEVLILIEGQKRFYGKPGVVNGQKAVQINDVAED